ncbi:hypothetical protein RZS08_06075 [Arthrospira platensis SPKY1]|nr:hypothetical protein [Arthrospira platensis SPKY1]
MSDYLSNLVARTLAAAPVLQPRQPSLFEPVGGGWGLGNRDWGVAAEAETAVSPLMPSPTPPPVRPVWPETAVATSPPIQPARPETAAVTPPPAAVAQPQPAPPPAPHAEPLAASQPERPMAARMEKKTAPSPPPMTIRERIIQQTVVEKKERLVPAGPPPAAPIHPAKAMAVPVPVAVQPRPLSPPPPPVPETVKTRPQDEPPIRSMPAVPKRPSAAEPPVRIVERQHPTSEPSPPPKPDKRQVAPPPTIRERILPPTAATSPERERATNGRYASEPPPPTIQVHIGRIEVRATPPPQPVAKSRPTPALTSLDDYLRQRNGGSR